MPLGGVGGIWTRFRVADPRSLLHGQFTPSLECLAARVGQSDVSLIILMDTLKGRRSGTGLVNKGNDTDRQGVVKKTVLHSGAVFFSSQSYAKAASRIV
jgi:hypothetical protein